MLKDMFDDINITNDINVAEESIFLDKSDEIIKSPLIKKDQNIIEINDTIYLRINNNTGNHYCLLDGEIYQIHDFENLIILINSMTAGESLLIDIVSHGGSVSIMNVICSAIFRCKGKVITNILSFAYSAASAIWACGHELRLSPNAHALFHMGITFGFGRIDEIIVQNNITYLFLNKLFRYFVNRGILTEEELEMILVKKIDVILPYSVLKERIEIANNKKINNLLNTTNTLDKEEDRQNEE